MPNQPLKEGCPFFNYFFSYPLRTGRGGIFSFSPLINSINILLLFKKITLSIRITPPLIKTKKYKRAKKKSERKKSKNLKILQTLLIYPLPQKEKKKKNKEKKKPLPK